MDSLVHSALRVEHIEHSTTTANTVHTAFALNWDKKYTHTRYFVFTRHLKNSWRFTKGNQSQYGCY